jgi:hypothetical protein
MDDDRFSSALGSRTMSFLAHQDTGRLNSGIHARYMPI